MDDKIEYLNGLVDMNEVESCMREALELDSKESKRAMVAWLKAWTFIYET